MKQICRNCKYCKKGWYANENANQHKGMNHPRLSFYCSHSKIKECQKKYYPNTFKTPDFLGWDDGVSFKLETLKTSPKHCPLKFDEFKESNENDR